MRYLKRVSAYGFIAPAVVVFVIGLVYPVCYSFYLSFTRFRLADLAGSGPVWVGLRNYIDILTSSQFHIVLKVTSVFISLSLVAELLLGFALALLVERKTRGIHLLRSLFILPMMIAPVVVGVVWRYMFNPIFGVINYLISLLGGKPIQWLSTPTPAMAALVLTDVWQWTPFVFLILLAGLQNIPDELLEAARIDGASYLQQLLHVKLPMLRSTIGLAVVLRLIDALRALVVPFTLTGGGPGISTEVLSLHIFKRAFESYRLGQASTLATFLFLLLLALSLALLRIFKAERRHVV